MPLKTEEADAVAGRDRSGAVIFRSRLGAYRITEGRRQAMFYDGAIPPGQVPLSEAVAVAGKDPGLVKVDEEGVLVLIDQHIAGVQVNMVNFILNQTRKLICG